MLQNSYYLNLLFTCHTAKDTTNKNTIGEGWNMRIKEHHLILTKRNIKHVNNWKNLSHHNLDLSIRIHVTLIIIQ